MKFVAIMNTSAVCTIISKNYLSYARVFAESFLKHNSGYDVHVLLVDRVEGYFDPEKEKFILTEIEQLDIDDLPSFCFKYNVTELNTAAKPFFIDYLFRKYLYKKVIYFDPDILVMNSLDELFNILDEYNVVLTPHITSPINDSEKHINEIDILMAGTYNLGFIGLSNYEHVKNFLSWWKDRLYKYCFSAPSQGLFVDQKWIDLLPGMIDSIFILRHPGYNVAYWNLHERKIIYKNGVFKSNGEHIYFFHFSGFVFNNLDCISKYQNRYSLNEFPDLRVLFEKYKDLLVQKEDLNVKDWPYAFGRFDNGVKIHDVIRQLYNGLREQGENFGNPFITSNPDSFFNWLNSQALPGKPITNLLNYIYHIRPDLRGAFPSPFDKNLIEFINWAKTAMKKEYSFDDRLIPFSDLDLSAGLNFTERIRVDYSVSRFTIISKIKNIIWDYGIKYATLIKSIPLINLIAIKAYNSLARERVGMVCTYNTGETISNITRVTVKSKGGVGINVAGYIDTESGVAEAARGIIRAVQCAKIPFVLNNIEQEFYRRNDKTLTDFSSENPYSINLIHVNADQVPHVANLLGKEYFNEKYNIGYWFWELSEFPDMWLSSFQYFDEIWVASDFCLDAISKVSPVPVVKITPSVVIEDRHIYGREYFGLVHDSFIFLTIFDFLSFIERKNPFAVIKAFKTAFGHGKDVTLLIKCTNSSYNHKMLEHLIGMTDGLNIKIIDRYIDKEELHSLINACDCYVSLHRSEGFGLPIAESMLLGKPVIATAYSGNMEFMNITNSFPVKYSLIEIEKDCGPYKRGNEWADPDTDHAAELMRWVFEKRDEARLIAQKASQDIKTLFNPDKIGSKIKKRLSRIVEDNLNLN